MESQEDLQQPREGSKVAVCGFAESYKQAPFDNPAVEVWGLNELHKYLPRWNRWFELHDDETLGVSRRDLSEGEQKRHLAWLSATYGDKPIYMQPQFCDGRFPNAVPLPLERLVRVFGRYFTSSIGYMVALAIADGYEWIGIYGVDLASDTEYAQQRANTEMLIGWAKGLGRTVEIASTSAICKAGHLYGFEKPFADHPVLAAGKKRLAGFQKEHEKCLVTANTLDGAIQESQNWINAFEFGERGVQLKAL